MVLISLQTLRRLHELTLHPTCEIWTIFRPWGLPLARSSKVQLADDCPLVQGGIGEEAERRLSGLQNWHVSREQQPYIDVFQDRKADLVYLTADSPNELSELDASKLYIIGGIVDRNRHKNICFQKAESQVSR